MSELALLRETYYGKGEVHGEKTYLLCLLEPGLPRPKPRYRLVIDVRVPVEGAMVITTLRYAKLRRDGSWYVKGPPTKVVGITYDPDPKPPGVWRGQMQGEWAVKRVRLRLRSRWERLR